MKFSHIHLRGSQADLDVYLEWNQTYRTKATGGEDTESDDESNDDEDAT
jgi:hypothetical protein